MVKNIMWQLTRSKEAKVKKGRSRKRECVGQEFNSRRTLEKALEESHHSENVSCAL